MIDFIDGIAKITLGGNAYVFSLALFMYWIEPVDEASQIAMEFAAASFVMSFIVVAGCLAVLGVWVAWERLGQRWKR